VSPTQVSAIVPAATTPGNAQVTVLNGATRSNTVTVRVAPTAPGVFAVPPRGFGPGAILKADFSLVTPRNPARRGETVLIFLTGLGAVSPSVADGTPAPANPLSRVTAPVNVYIGRRRANVTFQGLSPNLVALYQLNVEIPANAPGGPAVPLAIETADAFHDQVDIAIAP
jgi:adhesin/invasin